MTKREKMMRDKKWSRNWHYSKFEHRGKLTYAKLREALDIFEEHGGGCYGFWRFKAYNTEDKE